jgi:hypothetical protein
LRWLQYWQKLTPSFHSIVIIHGLNGDATESWTYPDPKAFWPKDFLPCDIPEARVMTFGYNADAAFAKRF